MNFDGWMKCREKKEIQWIWMTTENCSAYWIHIRIRNSDIVCECVFLRLLIFGSMAFILKGFVENSSSSWTGDSSNAIYCIGIAGAVDVRT